MSGGRATLQSRKGRGRFVVSQVGDISAISELGHPFLRLFVLECKFYKELKLETLIYGGKGNVDEFWYKTCRDAAASGRQPLVITRQNRRDELVWTTAVGLALLRRSVPAGQQLRCFTVFPVHGIHVVHLREMLLVCDPVVLSGLATPARKSGRRRFAQVSVPKKRRRYRASLD